MKDERHLKIMNYIKEEEISTQEELAAKLKAEGIEVTQATVSRDIKELGLIKVPIEDGGYKYALPPQSKQGDLAVRMRRIFRDSVLNIDYSNNLIVINTLPGTAQGVASLLDNADWDHILGTVAGDDTILIIVKPPAAVKEIMLKLHSLSL